MEDLNKSGQVAAANSIDANSIFSLRFFQSHPWKFTQKALFEEQLQKD